MQFRALKTVVCAGKGIILSVYAYSGGIEQNSEENRGLYRKLIFGLNLRADFLGNIGWQTTL